MGTPSEVGTCCKYGWETTFVASATPDMTAHVSYLKQELLLHDWWLIKVISGCHGKRLGVGGFTSKESQGIRCFASASIVKRHDAVTLTTVDGITIMVNGPLNKARTLENGFSCEVCDHFVIGFPYYWEEFSVVKEAEGEEPQSAAAAAAAAERITIFDGHKTPGSSDLLHMKTRSKVSIPNNSNSGGVHQYSSGRVTRSRKCKSSPA